MYHSDCESNLGRELKGKNDDQFQNSFSRISARAEQTHS